MAKIYLDGKVYEADGADNLLSACLSLGLDIPYFCYHPALGSVGSCRQCAVKQYNNEEDRQAGRGRIVMSCMVPTNTDLYISIDDDESLAFRKRVVEYLMTNHPHDCPTCEEGGHCHLQDMTYASGHNRRRYRFVKRTHQNQDLGAFINHEMNRCIACYRCVRFYKDYAGGTDFGVYASANRVYFGRETDGQLLSEFSGNLTEVCPTGVFTDKTHSDRYNRKWDMQYAPSVCAGCSTGCNISAGERYGELRRIENRYNPDVNGYFLCDKGRFGYGYVNLANRPLAPLEKTKVQGTHANGTHIVVSSEFALDGVAQLLKNKSVIGIGSPNASLESNYALKTLVGDAHYSTGQTAHSQRLVADSVSLLRHHSVHNVSVAQIEKADCVLVLGEDVTQTASRVALSIRQAAKNKAVQMATALKTQEWLAEPVKRIGQNQYSPIYVASVADTKLTDIAKTAVVADIEEIATLGYKVGDVLASFGDDLAQIVQDEEAIFAKEHTANLHPNDIDKAWDSLDYLAHHIAYDLLMADRPLVVAGTSLESSAIVNATGYICQMLSQKRTQIKVTERQYLEVEQAKLSAQTDTPTHNPELLAKPEHPATDLPVKDEARVRKPMHSLAQNESYADKAGVYMVLPCANSVGLDLLGGKPIEEVLAGDFEVALILENDLAGFSQSQKDKLFAHTLIVLDHQRYDWHERADFVLPVASFAEGDGTLVSAEGRAQRYFAVYDKKHYLPHTDIKDAWRWLFAIGDTLGQRHGQRQGQGQGVPHFDELLDELASVNPNLALVKQVAPLSDYRITGLKIAREPRRYSGRTSLRAKLSIHEPMQPKDADSALTFSMEGYVGEETDASVIPFAWSAGWNSPQAWNKLQTKVGGNLKGGDVGIRLFDYLPKTDTHYTAQTVHKYPASSVFAGRAKLVPMYNLFASNALVASSPVVASQIKAACFWVNADDAKLWGLKDGTLLQIDQNEQSIVLPVAVCDYVADGCIGYIANLVPLHAYLPASVKQVDDVPVFVPMYAQRVQAVAGKRAPSLAIINTNGKTDTFNNQNQTVKVDLSASQVMPLPHTTASLPNTNTPNTSTPNTSTGVAQ
ncbi:NADH-quinone oxidoreductase subunit NuoG [Moraxella sp. Pampa]|uniref:NADH-quinone oxidoreductase subunit NuoG n=1 Tax=Moraxella sp. Pampa TaxID=3111978 RepID=UPI002B4097FE|nr:NADH-quinone oxidoreductase subunit NuoG [Moraxella sp. Pampa]